MTEAEETVVELNIKVKVTFFCSLATEAKAFVDINISLDHNRIRTRKRNFIQSNTNTLY